MLNSYNNSKTVTDSTLQFMNRSRWKALRLKHIREKAHSQLLFCSNHLIGQQSPCFFLSFHVEESAHRRPKCIITALSVHCSCKAGTINPAFSVIDIGFAFNLFHYTDHEIRNVPILIDLHSQTHGATTRRKELKRREPHSHEITSLKKDVPHKASTISSALSRKFFSVQLKKFFICCFFISVLPESRMRAFKLPGKRQLCCKQGLPFSFQTFSNASC